VRGFMFLKPTFLFATVIENSNTTDSGWNASDWMNWRMRTLQNGELDFDRVEGTGNLLFAIGPPFAFSFRGPGTLRICSFADETFFDLRRASEDDADR